MGLADKAKDKAGELCGQPVRELLQVHEPEQLVDPRPDLVARTPADLETEGRMQEANADVKQAGENVRDSGDDVTDALRSASGATKFDDKDTTRFDDTDTLR